MIFHLKLHLFSSINPIKRRQKLEQTITDIINSSFISQTKSRQRVSYSLSFKDKLNTVNLINFLIALVVVPSSPRNTTAVQCCHTVPLLFPSLFSGSNAWY